jgi:hypothetical protein
MGDDSQADGNFVELFRCRTAADAPAVLATCKLCDRLLSVRGTTGKDLANPFGEAGHILLVQFFAAFCAPVAPALAGLFVGQTFRVSLGQSLLFDQQALSFVSLPGATPFDRHRVPSGMLLRATS